jgi:hypothetical protein
MTQRFVVRNITVRGGPQIDYVFMSTNLDVILKVFHFLHITGGRAWETGRERRKKVDEGSIPAVSSEQAGSVFQHVEV